MTDLTDAQRRALRALTGEWACGGERAYVELYDLRPALVERALQDWCVSHFVVRLTAAGLALKAQLEQNQ